MSWDSFVLYFHPTCTQNTAHLPIFQACSHTGICWYLSCLLCHKVTRVTYQMFHRYFLEIYRFLCGKIGFAVSWRQLLWRCCARVAYSRLCRRTNGAVALYLLWDRPVLLCSIYVRWKQVGRGPFLGMTLRCHCWVRETQSTPLNPVYVRAICAQVTQVVSVRLPDRRVLYISDSCYACCMHHPSFPPLQFLVKNEAYDLECLITQL